MRSSMMISRGIGDKDLAASYALAEGETPGGAALSDANSFPLLMYPRRYDVSDFAPHNTALRLRTMPRAPFRNRGMMMASPARVVYDTASGDVVAADFVQPSPSTTFARASTAYTGATQISSGVARTRSMLITNPVTATIDTGSIWAVGGSAEIGVFGTNGANVYHRTPTGTEWGSAVGTITSGSIQAIWVLASGTLIASVDFSGSASKLFRSVDYGVNWTDELTMEYSSGSKREQGLSWNLHQASHGTIIFAAYGTTNDDTTDRNIYKSTDDGSTWVIKETIAADSAGDHFQGVGYQETAGVWVAAFGDSADAAIHISSDDGENWAIADAGADDTMGPGAPFQPVRFLDYGHATRLMFASDESFVLGTFDVSDFSITRLYGGNGELGPGGSSGFVFELFLHDGIHYACVFDNSGGAVKQPIILVSDDDGATWDTYWRDDSETLRGCGIFSGVSGGNLFIQAITTAGANVTVLLPIVRSITSVTGTIVENAYTPPNSPAESTCEATTEWATNNCSIATNSANEFIGTNCIEITATDETSFWIVTPSEPKGAGRYCFGFRLKGAGVRGVSARMLTQNPGADGTVDGTPVNISVTPNYNYFITPPCVIGAADNTPIRLKLTGTPHGPAAPGTTPLAVLFVDSIAIIPIPSATWHIGSDARADETVAFARTVGASWVDSFVVAPMIPSLYLDDIAASPTNSLSPMFLRTWKVDGSNYLELTYDPATRIFSLVPTIATSAQSAIALGATYWRAFDPIQFIVEANASGITLRMHNGNTWETVTGSAEAALLNEDLTVQSGDNAKANLLPHVIVEGFGTT